MSVSFDGSLASARPAVTKELSREHAPSEAHGVDRRRLNTADYTTKLGLELADPRRKRAKNGRQITYTAMPPGLRPRARQG